MEKNFWYYKNLEEKFLEKISLIISKEFLILAGNKLWRFFDLKTGINDIKNSQLGIPFMNDKFIVEQHGNVSKVDWYFAIRYSSWPVTICWKSKSGRIYKISDEDIDENDIEFWFEGLDPVQIYKDLYPNFTLPFKLKDIYFEVDVKRLDMSLEMAISFMNKDFSQVKKVEQLILDTVDDWNKKAEKDTLDEKGLGIVHSVKTTQEEPDKLVLSFDMGTASVNVLKKLIQTLNKKTTGIKLLVID